MLHWLRKTSLMTTLAGAAAAVLGTVPALAGNLPEGTGYSSPGQTVLQGAATDVMRDIQTFYDLTNIVIIAIAVFVALLMVYVMVKFSEKANPVPSKTTHNTLLEVAWTVIPIFILVAISIPSFKLLMKQYTYPKPDLTIKATGNAWFWEHTYPDMGGFTITSNYISDKKVLEDSIAASVRDGIAKTVSDPKELQKAVSKAVSAEYASRYGSLTGIPLEKKLYDDAQQQWAALKKPRLLAVDNEIVVPVNKTVHVLVTSNDVIHNWTIPSFGSKTDAVPGRVTSTWFKAEQEGAFYGQCSELCGLNHAFMPIAVRVVSESVFADWSAAMKAKDKAKAKAILDQIADLQDGRTSPTSVADATK
jgi:cytochrome c oxidase subunit II